jgi:cell division septal protein FtsQ
MTQSSRKANQQSREKTKSKKKKRKKSHFFLNFFIVLLLLGGLAWFASSDFFAIDKISVIHNNNYTKDEIIAMSEVKTGRNIFWLSQMPWKGIPILIR